MSFLTAASDRSSSGSGVSGVSGASFSGVSGFTSSFSFTTVLVLVAINNLLPPLSGETRTPTSGSPYPMGRVHDPTGLSPPHLLIYLRHGRRPQGLRFTHVNMPRWAAPDPW